MFFVDTNIFLYAVDSACSQSATCLELINYWRRSSIPWHTSWSVVFEFLRAATHPRIFPQPIRLAQAWQFMEAILSSPKMSILVQGDAHQHVMKTLVEEYPDLSGNILHDLRNAALMREHGISRIYTRDTDFHRFKFLEVVNPVDG